MDVPQRLPTCASEGRGEDSVFGRNATAWGTKWKEEETVKTSPELRRDLAAASHPGDSCACRASPPRAAHHEFPSGTFPVKVNITSAILLYDNASSVSSEIMSSVSLVLQI